MLTSRFCIQHSIECDAYTLPRDFTSFHYKPILSACILAKCMHALIRQKKSKLDAIARQPLYVLEIL